MSTTPDGRDLPVAVGVVSGIVAWAAGYAFTYAVVAPEVRNTPLNQIIGALDGGPATYEIVGWVFYNAHFVETVFRGVPLVGGGSANSVGGDGFTPVLYLVPAGLLLAAGVALARVTGAADASEGLVVGLTALPGYLLLSLAGVFLFEVSVGGTSGRPDLLTGAFLAGVVYPVLFAGGGGALAAAFGAGQTDAP